MNLATISITADTELVESSDAVRIRVAGLSATAARCQVLAALRARPRLASAAEIYDDLRDQRADISLTTVIGLYASTPGSAW